LTVKDFALVALVAVMNSLVTLILMYFFWRLLPLDNPDAFSAELPDLFSFIFQMAAMIPFAEIFFYGGHWLMHRPWFWFNIHHWHHIWKAPFVPCAIFCHPLEHIIVNITTVSAGPFLFGAHASVWIVFTVLAIISTCQGHSGWHLPILGSMEEHDFHHLQGLDNMGTLNVMDTVFYTNTVFLQSWQAQIDKNYMTPDYPVDKVIYSNGQASEDQQRLREANDMLYQRVPTVVPASDV